MIVKILSKSGTFNGVKYNTNKVEKNKGELMKVKNFGILQGMSNLRPQDYINYLKSVSALNPKVKQPQFHAVISCKGREKTKEELTILAEKWLREMGYGNNPFLLVYHKDTKNNHIHMVSTRVGKDGKKISDSFEKLRAYEVLNKLMGVNKSENLQFDLASALTYNFSTKAQFLMLLEAKGYSIVQSEGQFKICKYGKELSVVNISEVEDRISSCTKDKDRMLQLRSIFHKYSQQYSGELKVEKTSAVNPSEKQRQIYSSQLSEKLTEIFGLQILYHSKGEQKPYGYTVIDHAEKNVFKGGDIMELSAFTGEIRGIEVTPDLNSNQPETAPVTAVTYDAENVAFPELNIDISDDIDDEAIHGRNRRHKKHARTNSR